MIAMTALLLCIVCMTTLVSRASSFSSRGATPSCVVGSRSSDRVGRAAARSPPLHSTKESDTVIDDSSSVHSSSTQSSSSSSRVSVSKPSIHWTVPGFKVGWQDDAGDWHDADGPRNGPPQNYWRQSADEREYDEAMDAVDAVLTGYDVEAKVTGLERKCNVRKPSLSRKALGRWAPLSLAGERVAYDDRPSDDGGEIEVPFAVDIARRNGKRFGPRNHYGVFYLQLEAGEELIVATTTAGGERREEYLVADEGNERVQLGTVVDQVQMQFGGITYVSDYIMIQRRSDGAIDFFLRADESYLGASDEEEKKYHLV